MTKEELISELKSYRIILAKIQAIEEDIRRYERLSISTGCSIGDGMPHGSGSKEARYTRIVEKIVDLKTHQECEIEGLMVAGDKILGLINLCPNKRQRDILELRYRYGWNPKKISAKINKCDRNVYALHDRGIESILKELQKKV